MLDKASILKSFPKNIELSYESSDHKKVFNHQFYLAIPEGKRGFMWFTEYQNQNVCFFLEIGQNKQIHDLRIVKTSFSGKLSYGTIFYGTEIKIDNRFFFLTEDIFYYKGKNLVEKSYYDKLNILLSIYSKKEIVQVSYFHSQVVFCMPLIFD
jgi:hypothetical protein